MILLTTVSLEASPKKTTCSLYQTLNWMRRKVRLAFFVRSAEIVPCPCCGKLLIVIGSRPRVWYQSSGGRSILIIRRLRCESCFKIHHELPDLLVPYKRYDAESIEGVLNEPPRRDIAVDESTLSRWKLWFAAWVVYAQGCLQMISIRYNLPVENSSDRPQSALQRLGQFVGNADGWLRRIVRPIANSHLWIHTRSAFMSAFI